VLLGEKAGQSGLSSEKCGVAAEFCQRCISQVFIVHYVGGTHEAYCVDFTRAVEMLHGENC